MMWFIYFTLFHVAASNITQSYSDDIDFTSAMTTSTSDLYNSSELSTENYCNSTECSNTTSTTISIPTTTRVPDISKKVQLNLDDVCLCNLHRNICDINCCCDQDCNFENKRIFDHCEEIHNFNTDSRACKYIRYDYENFTMHEWEVQNNDLFCVVRNNVPPSYTIQKKDSFKNYEEATLEKDMRYAWPQRNFEDNQQINYSVPYRQGDSLRVILDKSTIDTFKINENFISSGCNLQLDAQYLNDVHNECVQVVNEKNFFLDANYYSNFFFIARPNMFNYTKLQRELTACKPPACLKSNLKICSDILLRNCINGNKTDISFRCFNVKENITCENVVMSLKYIFYHDGLNGIKQINLSLHLENFTYESTESHLIDQSISVEFQWHDADTSLLNLLSGNPGYLIKSPILTGILSNGTILRYADSYLDDFMVLPYEDMGVCGIGKYTYLPIEFGYNTILQCEIQGSISSSKNEKPTDICKKLQFEIFKYWNIIQTGNGFVERTFGYFGNANLSIRDDWKQILYDRSPKHIISNITGRFYNKNITLSCTGLVFGLNIDIYHARVDLKKLVGQEKILGITHSFQRIRNESMVFSINNSKIEYGFNIDTKVSFWDVTSKKIKKLVDPPSLNIKLPSDFFYPFVKMNNGSRRNMDIFFSIHLVSWLIFPFVYYGL